MRMLSGRLSKAAFCVACLFVLGLATAIGAIERGEPALAYPVERVYPLVAVDAAGGKPSAEEWAKAFPGEGFFAAERIEEEGGGTVFRMLKGKERLYVRVECASRGTADSKELVEFHITQFGKPDFPCIAVETNEDGAGIVGVVRRAQTWWINPQVIPLDETVIPRQAVATEKGWTLEFSLPFDELNIPRDGFRFNVVHDLADGERYAWSDIGGRTGPSNVFDVFATALSAEKAGFPGNGLKLPAPVKAGLNRYSLEKPDPGLRLQVGENLLQPKDGIFDVIVRNRGPLDMLLKDKDGKVIATYHADVRRPLLIDVNERYLPADAKEFDLEVALDTAGDAETPITFTCVRGKGKAEEHEVSLKPGLRTLKLAVPAGDGYEVRITARAALSVPAGAQPITVEAMHWFAVGVTEDDIAVYRPGIRSLPTDQIYWAIITDVIPCLLQSQQGDGRYNTQRLDRWGRMSPDMASFLPALLYKTQRPGNPFFGDKRLLDSAIMGMEHAFRPEIRVEEYNIPDGRSPQALLLTYDLLKNDVSPEMRAYWETELKHRVDGEVVTFLRRIVDKVTFYSADCDTSTNVMAYHIPNVYLAGKLFGRQDWMDLATMLARRLAWHGREGHFEEQAGSPVNHYTWMTTCSLGEYYQLSGDETVLPTLEACARYMTAMTTGHGGVMALHDSRSSGHSPFACGEFVLSLTPEGRWAARTVILERMGESPAYPRGEPLFKLAENALYFRPGEEKDVFSANSVMPFRYGIIVRKDGFQYGLSTIARGAVVGLMRIDAQNAIEMFHNEAGCILHGGGSQQQPEAGTFWRKLDEPEWEGKSVASSNDYLPIAAVITGVPDGYELGYSYRTFETCVTAQVFSPGKARLEVFADSPKGPVTYSFFPGVSEDEDVTVDPDGKTLRFRQVTLRANVPFKVDKGFRMFNPYTAKYVYTYKPVRCWLELKSGETFVLDISVAPG